MPDELSSEDKERFRNLIENIIKYFPKEGGYYQFSGKRLYPEPFDSDSLVNLVEGIREAHRLGLIHGTEFKDKPVLLQPGNTAGGHFSVQCYSKIEIRTKGKALLEEEAETTTADNVDTPEQVVEELKKEFPKWAAKTILGILGLVIFAFLAWLGLK